MRLFQAARFLLYLVPFSVILVSAGTLFPFIVIKYTFFRAVIDLALSFTCLGFAFAKKSDLEIYIKNIRSLLTSPLFLAIGIFFVVSLLSTFFAYDALLALWSDFERGEGMWQLVHLFLLFILTATLFRDSRDWKKLLYASISAGILMITYGLFVSSNASSIFLGPSIQSVLSGAARFYGSLGNSTYVGSYLIFILFFLFYVFFEMRKKHIRGILLFIAAFFLLFTWFAQTRGPVLGILAGIFAFLIYLAVSKWREWGWKIGVGLLVIIMFSGGIFYFRDTPFGKSLPGARLLSLNFDSSSFQSRLWTWNSALQGIKERPLLGWGFENFAYVFNKHFDTRHYLPGEQSETWYDRAHNLFLDYGISTGIIGLASFLAVFVMYFKTLFILRRDQSKAVSLPHQALFFAVPVAYFVQGITIFDVLPISLNLFLFFAFANFVLIQNNNNV